MTANVLKLRPEAIIALQLTQDAVAVLELGTPHDVVHLELVPAIFGQKGDKGDPGGGVTDAHYEHIQAEPSAVWEIEHALGKQPAVSIVDSSGEEVEGEVDRTLGLNRVRVTFCGAFSGAAYLN